jgi:5-methylcytosine-specific restriction endonuclease McrA
MFTEELRTARSALEAIAQGFDASCSGREAVRLLEQLATIHHLADGVTARVAKRIADTNAFVAHGDRTAEELCGRLVGVGAGDARRAIESATRWESLPATDAAVREGRLSAQEAALISSTAVHDPAVEPELLAASGNGLSPLRDACVQALARTEDPQARAQRQHAARSLKMWNSTDGMVEGHFRLTPEVGGGLRAAIEQQTQAVFRAKYRDGVREPHHAYAADAFARLVMGEGGAGRGPGGYTAHVVIDHAVLVRGAALPGETCEIPGVGPVNAQWVRELLGEAFVTAVVKKGRDITTVAHFGRHIPAELRTAMIVGGRECCIAGCTRREYLEIDHSEIDYANGGPAAWWNLQHLCSVDHRRKTQGWLLGPPDPVTGKRSLSPPGTSRAA